MIHANGVDQFYEEFGNACAAPVLLVMGNSAPDLVWPDAFCELIASAGFRVVRFDQRNTGLSTHVEFNRTPYTLDDLVLRHARAARFDSDAHASLAWQ